MGRGFAALLFLSLSVGACSPATVAPPPAPPVDWASFERRSSATQDTKAPTTKERAAAEVYTNALLSPGCGDLGRILDEDVHFQYARTDAHGRDRVIAEHDALFGAFEGRKIAIRRVFLTDSTQALEWTMTGVQQHPWMGIAPTHRSVALQGLTLLFTKDTGSISDVHIYFDSAVIKAQLGNGPGSLLSLPLPQLPDRPTERFEQAHTRGEAADAELVRSSLDAVENKKESAYLKSVSNEVEVHRLELAAPERGKQQALVQYRALHKAIGQLDLTITNLWGIEEFVVVEYLVVGEQLAPIGPIPMQRDTVLRMQVADVVEVRDGAIARVWRYDNPSESAR